MAPSSDDFIRVSDIAELENFSIPELITYLKTEFRSEAYKKAAKILISREEKQNLEIKRLRTDNKRFNGLEQRYRLLLTRVAKLEEETKALSRLASHISENVDSNLDVGIGTSEKKGTTCVTKEDKIQREINGGVSDSVGIQSLHHALDEGTGSGRVEGYSGTSENKWMKCEGEEDKSERKINGRVRNSAGIQSICHTPEQGRGSERVEGPAVVTPLSKPLIKTKEELERSSTPNSGPPFATPLCKPLIKTKEEQEWSSTLKSSIGKSTPKIVVEISDSDSEKENEAIPKETFPNNVTTRTYPSPKNEENKSSSCEKFSSVSTLKRKRLLRIVDTDSDDGSDNETRVEKFPKKVVTKTCSSQKGDEINSSCESRRALKVTNSDSKEDDNLVTKDPPKDEISKILSGIRKWEACWKYEVDMVKSFEIDPLLCMKAVCTLYRRRLFEKKADGGSSKLNNRRFSLSCEERGTSIAKFLLDGNEECEMKRSVKELEVYDPKGLQECQKLAYHYSNQLFTIYQNKEDPFFP